MKFPHPAPGRFELVHGTRLHVQQHSAGDEEARKDSPPTIVLEAALGGSSLGWLYVERAVRSFAPTLSYDRAGLGFSDPGLQPRTLERQVDDLAALLRQTTVPPFVLVGHSLGALLVWRYAQLHPHRTAGLVLVDPPSLREWAHPDAVHRAKLEAGVRLARRGELAARCGLAQVVAKLVEVGALTAAARLTTMVSGGRLRKPSDFNLAPAVLLPPEDKAILRWIWTRPGFYQAMASQMEWLPAAARAVPSWPPPGDPPLVVLSASDTPPEQLAEHRAWAAMSRRGRHRLARASGHWIPLEEPELIIQAVRWVWEELGLPGGIDKVSATTQPDLEYDKAS